VREEDELVVSSFKILRLLHEKGTSCVFFAKIIKKKVIRDTGTEKVGKCATRVFSSFFVKDVGRTRTVYSTLRMAIASILFMSAPSKVSFSIPSFLTILTDDYFLVLILYFSLK